MDISAAFATSPSPREHIRVAEALGYGAALLAAVMTTWPAPASAAPAWSTAGRGPEALHAAGAGGVDFLRRGGHQGQKVIALTFHDGPSPYTP